MSWRQGDIAHFCKKLVRVTRTLCCLFAAQMFGRYIHSGWNCEISFARYEWRGREWIIPTGPVEREDE